MTFQVDMPNPVTKLNAHLYLSGMWFRCGFKNGYQKDTCSKEIELSAQNMKAMLG